MAKNRNEEQRGRREYLARYMRDYRVRFPERQKATVLRQSIRYCQRYGLRVTDANGTAVNAEQITEAVICALEGGGVNG